MGALLEGLLELGGYFEPATSVEILAILGAVSVAGLLAFSVYRAGRAAGQGMGQLAAGLRRLLHASVVLIIALMVFWLMICLVRAALVHSLQ